MYLFQRSTRIWVKLAGRLAMGGRAKFSLSGSRLMPSPGTVTPHLKLVTRLIGHLSNYSRDSLDHLGGDLPLVDLLADDAFRPLVVLAALEALQALVPDPQRLVLQVDLNVARHVHLGRLPYQDL